MIFWNISFTFIIGLTKWKKSIARWGGNKKRYRYCPDSSGAILYFRALQGQSGRSLIDPILQDGVIIPDNFFQYIYHVGCAIDLHSIINSGLILGGQKLSNRQTVFFLFVDPVDKTKRILTRSTWKHRVLHNPCTKHGRNIKIRWHQHCSEERIEVLSDTIERHHSSRNTPSLLYPESCSEGKWRSHIRESICVTTTSSKDFLETWLDEIGFRSCSTTRGSSCSTIQKFPIKPTKFKPRSWWNARASRSQEIETRSFLEEFVKHDRTGKPYVCRDAKSRAINVKRGWHRLQNTRIATFCCEISSELLCSWIVQEDREPPSPTISSRRSTTKTKLTTRSVRRQSKWFRTWATWSCLNCSRQTLRRSAKNAHHTGAKASSIQHLRASLEKKWSQPRRHPIWPYLNSKLRI